MSYMRFNYHSAALQRYVDVSVVFPTDNYRFSSSASDVPMPDAKARPLCRPGTMFQTVYLLHGGGDDDSLVYRYTNAELFAQRNNVMLVTPNIANSFGANTGYGVAYQSFLGDELPNVIQALFASSPQREDNFIMGYAMGGNAALAAAIRYPERFCYCVDISGGIGYTLCTETLMEELEGEHFKTRFPLVCSTFGPAQELRGSEHDIRQVLLNNIEKGIKLPGFHLASGSREFIRSRVEADAMALRELGCDVQYHCVENYDHDFTFWNHYIGLALDSILPLRRGS